MQINVKMAGMLTAAILGEYIAMRYIATTWMAADDEAHAAREAPAAADPVPESGNRAAPTTAAAAPAADWHPGDGGWGGQAAGQGATGNASASGAQSAAGMSAAGMPVQAPVQASLQPPPDAAPAPSPATDSSDASSTPRNDGP